MSSLCNLLAAALLPALALACASAGGSYRVQANVRKLQSGSHDAAGITAVAGADVALKCTDATASRDLGKTDSDGALKVEGEGGVPLACKLTISQPGYVTSEQTVASACTETSAGASPSARSSTSIEAPARRSCKSRAPKLCRPTDKERRTVTWLS